GDVPQDAQQAAAGEWRAADVDDVAPALAIDLQVPRRAVHEDPVRAEAGVDLGDIGRAPVLEGLLDVERVAATAALDPDEVHVFLGEIDLSRGQAGDGAGAGAAGEGAGDDVARDVQRHGAGVGVGRVVHGQRGEAGGVPDAYAREDALHAAVAAQVDQVAAGLAVDVQGNREAAEHVDRIVARAAVEEHLRVVAEGEGRQAEDLGRRIEDVEGVAAGAAVERQELDGVVEADRGRR